MPSATLRRWDSQSRPFRSPMGATASSRSHGLTTWQYRIMRSPRKGSSTRAVRVSRASRAAEAPTDTVPQKARDPENLTSAANAFSRSASLIGHFESSLRNSTRMPGLSSGVPMNSMPANSRAALISRSVAVRL